MKDVLKFLATIPITLDVIPMQDRSDVASLFMKKETHESIVSMIHGT